MEGRFADYFNLGVKLSNQGDKHGAIKAWTSALQLNPCNQHAYYYRGVAKFSIADYKGAIDDLIRSIRIVPEYLNAHRQLSIIYNKLSNNVDNQPVSYNTAIDYYNLGILKFNLGEYQTAIIFFNQALGIKSDLADAYYHRGNCYHKLRFKDTAITDFQTAARILCENNQVQELSKWQPFELGESKRKEAISYLLPYLEKKRTYDEKRLAASAIKKLATSFRNIPDVAISLLLDNLNDSAPQVRQYTLKALSVIDIKSFAIPKIQLIAQNDSKYYNRNIAKAILENISSVSNHELGYPHKTELDNNHFLKQDSYDYEEFDSYLEQDYFDQEFDDRFDDRSMDYGYLDDLSNPEEYLY